VVGNFYRYGPDTDTILLEVQIAKLDVKRTVHRRHAGSNLTAVGNVLLKALLAPQSGRFTSTGNGSRDNRTEN
jgi:hypothetical protein